MGKITDITVQKKDVKRVNIFIDGDFAFGLSFETRFLKKLEIGQGLDEKKINELIGIDQVERLLNKTFKFLSFRPRSEKEIRDYLSRKGKLRDLEKSGTEKAQYEKSIEKVIQKLKKIGQIDDEEFAKWLVDQRRKFRPRGENLIKYELLQKGIEKEIIEKIIGGFHGKQGSEESTEKDLAMKAAEKKYQIYKKLGGRDFKIKMGQYLARRGFDWETIKKVVDTLGKKEVK